MVIPYGRQHITEADIDAVRSVLVSDFLTQGPTIGRFERAIANVTGAAHCVASNSATSSLHNACLALDVGPGDVVWTTPITFVASANCARYCGADVDFVDIDRRTYNLDPAKLADKLKIAERSGRLPKVVIPVHLSGIPADMPAIRALSDRYGFKVVEDASHAIGGRIGNRPVGACEHSDITVFSFHPVKIVTTGEGGLALTNDARLAQRMRLLRSHGVTRDPSLMQADDGPWYYEQIALGYNYRLTDIQAALGLSQLGRLDEFVGRRRELASRYDAALAGLPLATPSEHPDARSSYHLYVIRLDPRRNAPDHRTVFERLRNEGIGVNLHYMPVYLQPYYRELGFRPGHCPQAEAYYAQAISIPLFPDLTEADQDQVVEAIIRALQQ